MKCVHIWSICGKKNRNRGQREEVFGRSSSSECLLQQDIPQNLGYAVLSDSNNDDPSCGAGPPFFSEDKNFVPTLGCCSKFAGENGGCLAHTLHLAPNTVANAYHALERGGWITTPGRKATSVVASPPTLSREEQLRPLRITIQHLLAQAAQLGLSAAQLHEEVDQHLLIRAAPLGQ